MKVYKGSSEGGRKIVSVDGRPLVGLYPSNPRRNKFDWGSQPASPGAKHLAEALLADCAGKKTANPLASEFANERVSKLPTKEWTIESEEIEKWLRMRCGIGWSTQKVSLDPSASGDAASSSGELHLHDFPRFPSQQRQSDWLDSIQEWIKPDALEKQGFPRPKEVRLSRSSDSNGEEAFYVYLVFADRTPEEALAWEKIEPMVSWVRNLIWTETDARLWPYVKVKRQKELAGGLA
jgi:hypothetical protein